MSSTFFLPIFFTIMSSVDCTQEKKNHYTDEIDCYTTFYYINMGIVIICVLLFVPISCLTTTIFYEYSFGSDKKISKNSSLPDLFFFLEKMIISFIFIMINGGEETHYFLILSLTIFSFVVCLLNFKYPRYNENILNYIHKFCSLTVFWASFVLLIGKIFISSSFDGCLGLFFITEPILFLLIFYEKTNYDMVLSKIKENHSLYEILEQIKIFIKIIENKDSNRNYKVILKGYIVLYEEHCLIPDCALKKYLISLQNGNDILGFLYQHVEFLFQNCLKKFPASTEVRFAYALFLLKKMNKKKKAQDILNGFDKYIPSIEEEFIIYKCNKMLENDLINIEKQDIHNLDLIRELEYKKSSNQFKGLINNASQLYIDFWGQLLSSRLSGNEDLTKLNDYGSKINKIVEQINNSFQQIQKLKNNDYEILKLYYEFLNDILNDKEKANKLKSIIDDIDDIIENSEESEFGNLFVDSLGNNDEYCYIIVSGKDEKFGSIQNISLSSCLIFGFQKDELIGKPIELLIPDTFQEEHRKVMKNKLIEFKKNTFGKLTKTFSETKELNVFGRNKSKYLVELNIKVNILFTENNEYLFVASISKDHVFYNTYNIESNEIQKSCIVLTDQYLLIQNFTPNAFDILGLTSDAINSNYEITFFIKQFYEEFLQVASENEQTIIENKLDLKRNILNKKFKKTKIINWRKTDFFDKKTGSKIIDINNTNSTTKRRFSMLQNNHIISDEIFLLTVIESYINNTLKGYFFKFEKINDLSSISSHRLLSISPRIKKIHKSLDHKIMKYNTPKSKKNSKTELSSISSINNYFKINNNFIPNSTFNFKFNPVNFSYEGNNSIDNSLTEFLKNKVMEGIQENQNNDSSLIDESNEEEEDEEEIEESENINIISDDSSSFSTKNNKKMKSFLEPKYKNSLSNVLNNSNTNNTNKPDDDFYKINFSKIKYSVYDFNKGIAIEIKDYHQVYEVDKKIQDFIKKRDSQDKTHNENVINKGTFKGRTNNKINNLILLTETKESILLKEIEYALTKEDVHESITRFNKVSILVFILIIGIGFITLYYILFCINIIKMNSELIINSYLLLIYNSIGIYYTKELILLNNENYTNIPTKKTREEYLDFMYNNTHRIFLLSHKLISYEIASPIKLSKETSWAIKNESFIICYIKNDFNIYETYSTMLVSFVETNTALFNIGNKNISLIIPTDEDVFYFLHNCLNNVGQQYYIQGDILINELKNHIKKIKIFLIIGYIFFFIIIILIYILVIYAYKGISKRKDSYIEVFLEIEISVIRNSLYKCEKFNKKLQNGENYDDEEILSTISNIDTPVVKKKETNNENQTKPRIEIKSISNDIFFKIKLIFFLLLIEVFFSIIFGLFYTFLEKIQIYVKFSQQEILYNVEIYYLFNSLREFFFDKTQKILNITNEEYLNSKLDDIYDSRKKNMNYINHNKFNLPNDFFVQYKNLKNSHPCDYKLEDNYFENEEECLNFMSNSTKFGMDILLSYFIEEVRFLKELTFVYTDLNNPINNLTLTGTEIGQKNWPNKEPELSNYIKNDPINYFNMDYMKKMNIMFSNIILSFDKILNNLMADCLKSFLKNTKIPYVILLISYLSLCSVLFLFIWMPFVSNLNSIIYKTKKMLSIIPKEVLMSIENIEKLLDVNTNNVKNQKNIKFKK